ncbi:PC-esterase domain-containing protein 1A-like isoform X1 [Lates japonicus]|uniref:PC-esterase domain-containing protein 1A-like isoform X1 n=1 Tax=Lates japonicus TaxID=270547 RepID=A0AAD3MH02_LATJO|nr:PC-esterase domain-containing protein 1A-like isoform X1 [Lates japonicus]
MMKCVSHQQASQLLHNKFVVVLGDSIQRSVYKDLVLLLQKEKYLTLKQLKSKGEMSFEQDCLVEGGCLREMHNGTEYQEVRQFQSTHHLVRFYFVTRIYSRYMQSILEDFRHGLKPDVVIVNSCVWDVSRYNNKWIDDYKENLYRFFDELSGILPEETLVIWSLTMPLAERIKGGFLVPEIEHKAPQLRYDVIEANYYSGTVADAYGMDVLDLHFQFRFSLHHRTKDGVHWNALAHRRITSLLLQHTAQAWGVIMSCPLTAVEHTEVTVQQPIYRNAANPTGVESMSNYHYPLPINYFSNMERHPAQRNYSGYREEFFSDSFPSSYLNFEDNNPLLQTHRHEAAGAFRPALPPQPLPSANRQKYKHGQAGNGFDYRPPHHFEHYNEHHHQNVVRSRHSRRHYAPYTHHRPNQYARNGSYY